MNHASLLLVAATGISPLVHDLGLCLAGAALLAIVFEKLRFPSIAALLAAGVLIGPIGLGLVNDQQNVETIATLGLTLLLFVIGLEVNPRALLSSGATLLLPGILQVPLTVAVAYGVFVAAKTLGWAFLAPPYVPLYLGLGCAFSSTLLVVKLLQARLQLDTLAGRLCVGLLIFQDVWAIVVLAVQPNFEQPAVQPILLTFLGIAVVALVATVVARYVMSAAFRAVARSPELVVTVALGWCFGLGLFGANLGTALEAFGIETPVSVSMEMSALIAGASIAAFPYSYEVVGRVVHIRDFFVTLFFVGLGMSIPVPHSIEVLLLAGALALMAIALRWLVFLPLLYLSRLDQRNAFDVSTKLAQISEFCLVIAYLGMQLGHLSRDHVSVVIFAFIITALSTPFIFRLSERIYPNLQPLLTKIGIRTTLTVVGEENQTERPPRLLILGFHRVASALIYELERSHRELLADTMVVDFNVALHESIRLRGIEVVYGNAGNVDTLRHARADEAEIIVATVPDELLKETSNAAIVRAARELNPKAIIIATASRPSCVPDILAAGADHCIVVAAEAAEGLLTALHAALNDEFASYLATQVQRHGYSAERREILN